MVIDLHTHIFPDKIAARTIALLSEKGSVSPRCDGTRDGLLRSMAEAGVDLSVILPVMTAPSQFESVNNFAASVNSSYLEGDKRLISFAGIHPACEALDERMEEIAARGFLGIKIHPDYQDTFIDDERYVTVVRAAKRHGLIVVTHSGADFAYRDREACCTPDRILRLLDKVGGYDRLVLAHYGASEMHDEVYEKLAGLDVYFDTAYVLGGIGKETFTKILEKHGGDKILFATDSPWSSQSEDIATLRSFAIDKNTESAILGGNARRLLGI